MILPIFKSHYSIGKSILTLELKHGEIGPRSIFNLCLDNDIKDVILVEDGFTGFYEAYQNAKKLSLELFFGLRLIITDEAIPEEKSLLNESKIILFIKNNNGYRDLIKVWKWAYEKGFYYQPRIDWKILPELLTENLLLVIPFYDSFIFQNSLTFSNIAPQNIDNVIFLKESNELPFDDIISNKIDEYIFISGNNKKLKVQDAQSIFYEKREDFLAYQTVRCIHNKSKLSKPELRHMSSDSFCLEHWKEKMNNE